MAEAEATTTMAETISKSVLKKAGRSAGLFHALQPVAQAERLKFLAQMRHQQPYPCYGILRYPPAI